LSVARIGCNAQFAKWKCKMHAKGRNRQSFTVAALVDNPVNRSPRPETLVRGRPVYESHKRSARYDAFAQHPPSLHKTVAAGRRKPNKCVPVHSISVQVHVFTHHVPIHFLNRPNFEKGLCSELAAAALRATDAFRRGETRAGVWPAPSDGGSVESFIRLRPSGLAAAAALRTLPVIPNYPSFPNQNEPTGFPLSPRSAAVVSARRQLPARAPWVTSGHVHAARESFLPAFGF
jgi:hypothetical protein